MIHFSLLSIDVSITRAEIEEAEENELDDGVDVTENVMKLPIAESLDVCMDILFKYFHSKLSIESTTSESQKKAIQDALFQYFSEHIIKTHNSKHVHFVFFYIASFRVGFKNKFHGLFFISFFFLLLHRNHFSWSFSIYFNQRFSTEISLQ